MYISTLCRCIETCIVLMLPAQTFRVAPSGVLVALEMGFLLDLRLLLLLHRNWYVFIETCLNVISILRMVSVCCFCAKLCLLLASLLNNSPLLAHKFLHYKSHFSHHSIYHLPCSFSLQPQYLCHMDQHLMLCSGRRIKYKYPTLPVKVLSARERRRSSRLV